LCKCMPQACVRTYLRERKIANLCDSRLTQVVTTCTGHPDDDCNALTDRRDESFARLQNGSNVTLQYGRKENFQNLTIFWPPTALNDPKATKDEDAVTFNVECFVQDQWHMVASLCHSLVRHPHVLVLRFSQMQQQRFKARS